MALMFASLLALSLAAQTPAQTPPAASGSAVTGGWTLNKDLSDAPPARDDRSGDDGRTRGAGRGGGGGGGRGYGRRGGGMGQGAPRPNPDEAARMRDAVRDVMNPSDHLIITQTESMVVITGADGRTTRLSPDGKKIKDENTGVERKTKWDGAKLVSEISGLGPGKMTQTFAVDPESHQLRLSVQMDGGRSREPRTVTHVYDADAK